MFAALLNAEAATSTTPCITAGIMYLYTAYINYEEITHNLLGPTGVRPYNR
jgi:hypothetical protein